MIRTVLLAALLASPSGRLFAQEKFPPLKGSTGKVAVSAERFVASLDDRQRALATFSLEDPERQNWHYVPFERNGLALKAMTEQQKRFVHVLLNGILSQRGYEKALQVIMLEQILAEIENNPERRDAGKYYVLVFGEPGTGQPWGLRFEGHHLSMNWTFTEDQIESTPSFIGGNPGKVAEGPLKGFRILASEEDLARKLLLSLSEQNRDQAIIADKAPRDILTRELPKAERLADEGLPVSEMTEEQQEMLGRVAWLYLGRNHWNVARREMAELSANGWKDVRFAWSGGTNQGEGHYYRIQSKDILIEFANTQNGAAHPHAVYRNLSDDFGEDMLRRHVQRDHENIGQ